MQFYRSKVLAGFFLASVGACFVSASATEAEAINTEIVCEYFCEASSEALRQDPMFESAYLGLFGVDTTIRRESSAVTSSDSLEKAWELNRKKCLPWWRTVYDSLPAGIAPRASYYPSVLIDDVWKTATKTNSCTTK